ncbi:pyridoxamine 5'-phosphate oxidase family protein [Actinokineospora fastidiosa]|uniref:Pyridoxamine 5'-phosphate oxidase n=1 Tax=Actinokineospora fastidiosa TaxID=1816 RepID=A0A918GKE7_9PSEU|nr:pyridoxamine 5'-phosphate oxidase family protein [Actinokineospora fastidiosa]GGS41188.1 pyridoxamine 5'-phosphate oxidase [Actinokineospora fastidiosa]
MTQVMTVEEREAFLNERRVGVIAVGRADRGPLAVPVWYRYADGEVQVWIERDSVKDKVLRKAGRFTLVAQSEELPYRYVSVEGPVVAADAPPTREQAVAIAGRYLSPEEADGYVDSALGESSVLVRMRPEKWLSSDQGKTG